MRKEDGSIGQMARQLYSKWKELAASEYGTSSSSKQKTIPNNIKIKTEEDTSSNQLSNDTIKVKKEYTSSSSPCKPKQDEHEKIRKIKNSDSSHSSSSNSKRTESTWNVKVEPSYSGYEDYESTSSKLNSEKSNKKNKLKDIEKKIKQEEEEYDDHIEYEEPVVEKTIKKEQCSSVKESTERVDTPTPKKKNTMSFEDMMMMPIFPTKKKKKKKGETVKVNTNTYLLSKSLKNFLLKLF